MAPTLQEKVLDLAKRRGFLYPGYELYGGAAGFYDYGPLGAQLKASLEAKFRQIYVVEEGAAEISTPAITIEPVLKASGHVDHFSDVVVTCKKCGGGFRADHFLPEEMERIRVRVAASKMAAGLRAAAEEHLRFLAKRIQDRPIVEIAEETRTSNILQEGEAVQLVRGQDQFLFRVGELEERLKCPTCGHNAFEPASSFNLMFKTFIGPGTGRVGYLRPETAQAMFVDFPHLYRYFREKLPFAACQIGRAYRNEIAPRQGLIRLREFNQMEVEAFFDPGTDSRLMTHPSWARVKATPLRLVPNTTGQVVETTAGDAVRDQVIYNPALAYHVTLVQRLLVESGIDPKRLRFRQHLKDEMAHYAKDCWDAEYESERFGWVECVGVAYRTDYDLSQHAKHSGKPLTALRRFDAPISKDVVRVLAKPAKLGPLFKKDATRVQEALNALDAKAALAAQAAAHVDVTVDGRSLRVPRDAYDVQQTTETVAGEDYVPHVIEPSYGQDRIIYGVLEHAYRETVKEGEAYTVLALPPAMAPVTVAIFPLMSKDGLDEAARKAEAHLRQEGLRVGYDETGTIGRRYARADEVGTPFALTFDYDTLKDQTVTLRDRDTTKQERVPLAGVAAEIKRRMGAARPPAGAS